MTEIIEGSAVVVRDEPAPPEELLTTRSQWAGDAPFFLIIEFANKPETGNLGIDIDTIGWAAENAEAMRAPGTWWLIHKQTQQPVLGIIVEAGDQPYFTKHHVGNAITTNELIAYGLGKRSPEVVRERTRNGRPRKPVVVRPETVTRLWLLPNGVVCGGDDVDEILARMVNLMPPLPLDEDPPPEEASTPPPEG